MDLNEQARALIQKIRHFIITASGRTAEKASPEEFYLAFCQALREKIMVNWTASFAAYDQKKPRILYYFSMEHLPGRLIGHHITNMGSWDLVKCVLLKMNRSIHDLMKCESDPGLGNGGLGRLASCLLDSLAAGGYPALFYGLRYQYGVFEQEIWNGQQVERPDCWLLNTFPWEIRRDEQAVNVFFRGRPKTEKNAAGEDVYLLDDYEEVRALPYDIPIIGRAEKDNFSVLSLRLWSTKESPRNFQLQRFNEGFLDKASENTSLTDVLYPNDHTEMGRRIRLKQELLLVSASLKDVVRRHLRIFGNMNAFADKVRIQINDTHPALVIAELIRCLTKDFHYPWNDAVNATRAICSYTNHTILREALEEWSERRLEELLPRQLMIIRKLNHDFCMDVRRRFPHDEERVRRMSIIEHGQVKMAHLAVFGSHQVNGVSRLHSQILKTKIFHDFHEMFPDRFTNVTNGVAHRRWLYHVNEPLAEFITERIGRRWIRDFKQIRKLAGFASDKNSQQAFLEVKRQNKLALIDFITKKNPLRGENGQIVSFSSALEPDALFDVQIKRFHEYKRQLLNALHLIMLYLELKDSKSNRIPRMAIFGGKVAVGYEKAKQIFRLISCMARLINRDPSVKDRLCVVMIENYNISKAEIIIPAADLSEQISTAGWEASGTGNMKLAMNGALTIGTDDGANVEMRQAVSGRWWPFLFGKTAEENAHASHYHGRDVYSADPPIRRAIDALIDGTIAQDASEQAAFASLHASLLEHDRFFVIRDLRPYYETQLKVEELYREPLRWAETAIHNVAAMGRFSSDESIRNYARLIWDIQPCQPDKNILYAIRKEYIY